MTESDDLHFERDVIDASREQTVLVDFWAPWCAPCRALGPVLERVEASMQGAVRVVKVNADDNPEASTRFGVSSIPFVVAIRDGEPIDQFVGALPEPQVRAFVERLTPKPGEDMLASARAFAEQGRIAEQAECLRTALAVNPALTPARLDYVRALLALGRAADARTALEPLSSQIGSSPSVSALSQLIEACVSAASTPDEATLRAALAAGDDDPELRFALARRLMSESRWTDAMDQLLEIIARARHFRDDLARLSMLAIFELCDDKTVVTAYRRKLGAALN